MKTVEYINDKNEFQSEVVKIFKKFFDKHNITFFDIHIFGKYKRDKNNNIDVSETNFDIKTNID